MVIFLREVFIMGDPLQLLAKTGFTFSAGTEFRLRRTAQGGLRLTCEIAPILIRELRLSSWSNTC